MTHPSLCARLGPVLLCLCLLVSTGCVTGSKTTASLGLEFGQGVDEQSAVGVRLSLEYTFMLHEPPGTYLPRGEWEAQEANMMCLGLTGSASEGWLSGGPGFNGSVLAGVDYLPFLRSGGHMYLGGQVGYGASQAGHGVALAIPRLGFGVTPWDTGTNRAGLGGRLSCLFAFQSSIIACGPAVTGTLINLGE